MAPKQNRFIIELWYSIQAITYVMDRMSELSKVSSTTPTIPFHQQPHDVAQSYVRILMLAAIIGLIGAQGDGWAKHSSFHSQVVLLPVTFCFLLLCMLLYKPDVVTARFSSTQIGSSIPLWRLALGVAFVFQLLSFVLFILEAKYYRAFGYQLHGWLTLMTFGVVSIMLLAGLFRREPKAWHLLLLVLGAYSFVYFLSIYSFPINVWRSDLLPVISAGNESLLAGVNPYHLYTFSNEKDLLTYLPGTWLPFLPFTMLGVDLRFANIIFTIAATLCVYFASNPRYRREVVGLFGLLLMCPYLQYRHELYLQTHWLSLSVCFLLLQRERVMGAAAAFGWSMATSQFSWILFPFLLLYIFRRFGLTRAVQGLIVASLVFGFLVGPFVAWSAHAFTYSVLTHWAESIVVNVRPMNLSFWVTRLLPVSALQPIQALILGMLLLYCTLRVNFTRLADCFQWMSIALLSFILLNRLVWGYFYLTLAFMMIMSVVARDGRLTSKRATVEIDPH
jgi:hypothetical protein